MKVLNYCLIALVGLLLLLPDARGEAGGDLNLTNKASLSSRTGYNLNLSTQGSSDSINFIVAGTSKGTIGSSGFSGLTLTSPTVTGDLTLSTGNVVIGTAGKGIFTNTIDGTDNKNIILSGGGGTGTDRGARFIAYGNELTGSITVDTGTAAGADALIQSNDDINFNRVDGTNTWSLDTATGVLTQNATNGDFIVLTKANTSVALPVINTLTATGTVIGDALQLSRVFNNVTTVAVGTGVKLWNPSQLGVTIYVKNRGANALNVWPTDASGSIDGAGGGSAVSIATGAMASFTYVATNTWISSESPAA